MKSNRDMSKNNQFLVAIGFVFLLVAAWIFFQLVPHEVDRRANALGPTPPRNEMEAIPAIHRELRIVDLHADTLLWDRDLNERAARGHVDVPRLLEGGVDLQVFSVVTKSPRGLNYQANAGDSDNITLLALAQRWPIKTWGRLSERALYQARRLFEAARASDGKLRVLLNKRELAKFLEDKKTQPEMVGAVLAIEGAHALEGDLELLEAMDQAGFRMIAPVHLFDSELAGSAQGVDKAGLTDLGRQWVAEMNRRQLIIDLAHVSEIAINEIIELSSRPVVVSHTGVRAVCDTGRNLSDEQLRKIASKGGLIGIGFWPEVTCAPTLEAIAASLEHAVQIAGEDAVALGSDWDGFVMTPIDASQIGLLSKLLLEQGWSVDRLRKVMGENALRFFSEQLPD